MLCLIKVAFCLHIHVIRRPPRPSPLHGCGDYWRNGALWDDDGVWCWYDRRQRSNTRRAWAHACLTGNVKSSSPRPNSKSTSAPPASRRFDLQWEIFCPIPLDMIFLPPPSVMPLLLFYSWQAFNEPNCSKTSVQWPLSPPRILALLRSFGARGLGLTKPATSWGSSLPAMELQDHRRQCHRGRRGPDPPPMFDMQGSINVLDPQ